MTELIRTIVSVALACLGCEIPTKIRFDGEPWHFACRLREAPALAAAFVTPRFLTDLEGAYQPKRMHQGKMVGPWWRPPMPEVMDLVRTSQWSWKIPYTGPRASLDRSGSWISAAASVDVAHGPLAHTGAVGWTGAPGVFNVEWFPWTEEGVPHPLGGAEAYAKKHGSVWVPHPRMQLLCQLAAQGRWPADTAVDSWTAAPGEDGKPAKVRLTRWTDHVKTVRAAALRAYPRTAEGEDSPEYKAVKDRFAQAVTMMIGERNPGAGRRWKCGAHRPDWGLSIQDQSAVTLWRWCDDFGQIARKIDRPDLAPVAMLNVDEILVPADAVEVFTTTKRPGGKKPLQLDPTGIELGTFKVKRIE